MTSDVLKRVDHGGGVAGIVLQRAPVNALTAQMLSDLSDLIAELEADPTVSAIVISSDFNVLSAGLDLREAQAFDVAQQNEIVEALNRDFRNLFACSKPVVTAINGAAIAGGLFFVLAADLRVAGPRAVIGLAEIRVGVSLPVGPMEIARATLDANTARRLLLTGQPMDAKDGLAQGVFDVLVEEEDVLPRAIEEARKLGALPPLAYAAIKQDLRGPVIEKIDREMAAMTPSQDGWFTGESRAAMQKMIG